VLFKEKTLGNCQTCRFWLRRHTEVQTDNKYPGLDAYLGDLGECRRASPKAHLVVNCFTEAALEECNKARKEHEKSYLELAESLTKSRDDQLRVAQTRLENIKESLATCRESSVSHWQAELVKQEEKVNCLLESYRQPLAADWDSRNPEPVLDTLKIVKGIWPLTSAEEFCGDWQER
jgi:vacuolar-type H+-ATPase subunit H